MSRHAYRELAEHFGQSGRLSAALEVLEWDMEVIMPAGSASDRAEQLTALRGVIQQIESNPRLEDAFSRINEDELNAWQQANVREMKRIWTHARAVPGEIIDELSRAGSACMMRWRVSRQENDFASLEPALAHVVERVKEKAQATSEALKQAPYACLLAEYEPGLELERLDRCFEQLQSFLPSLIQRVIEKQKSEPQDDQASHPVTRDAQRAFWAHVVDALGLDCSRSRLDESAHPFCGGTPDDIRITTRCKAGDYVEGLMGVIHECGHANYEQGLPLDFRYQPVGHARGMVIHESQSLLLEMLACRSRAFFQWLAPQLERAFGTALPPHARSPSTLFNRATRVKRGLIRVDADEVTYSAHVLLRYDIERQLLSGQCRVADLPELWRELMMKYVGVAPPDDRTGCMQDIHWMDGSFGYFPCYALGAMAGAQLFATARAAGAGTDEQLQEGDFQPLGHWLREHVHSHGSYFGSSDALLERITGTPLQATAYRTHLEQRYLSA